MTPTPPLVERLREMADGLLNGAPECWDGEDARAQVLWAQDLTVAAETLSDALSLLRTIDVAPGCSWDQRRAALLARCEGDR